MSFYLIKLILINEISINKLLIDILYLKQLNLHLIKAIS